MRLIDASLTIALLAATQSAYAGWIETESKDEMRGTATKFYAIGAEGPASGGAVLNVAQTPGQADSVFVVLTNDVFDCSGKGCEVEVKFDQGAVQTKAVASAKGGGVFFPRDSVAFAGSVAMSKLLFIELKLRNGGKTQLKFITGNAPFKRQFSHSFSLLGMRIGEKAELPAWLEPDQHNPALDCRISGAQPVELKDQGIERVRVCLFDGYFYSASVEVAGKPGYSKVSESISKVYGKPNKYGTFSTWPMDSEKYFNEASSHVSFMSNPKAKGGGRFMFMDDSISGLIPQAKK